MDIRINILLATIDNGIIKILLEKNVIDNKWIIPNEIYKDENTFKKIYDYQLGFNNVDLKQVHTFITDKEVNINYIGFVDILSTRKDREENLELETQWFEFNILPKLSGNNKEMVLDDIEYMRYLFMYTDNLKKFYPGEFTLPELKKVYDNLYNLDIDRRNFRKKLVNQNIIRETYETIHLDVGRPAKLYTFDSNNHFINIKEDL